MATVYRLAGEAMTDLFVAYITVFMFTVAISIMVATPWPALTFIIGTLSGIAIYVGDDDE